MKNLTISFLIMLFSFNCFAQKMRKISHQEFLGIKYSLPKDWAVDGFGTSSWEDPGSSVCNCSGTINIGDHFGEEEIYMVVYPSLSQDSLNALKRLWVWDMKFYVNGIKSTSEIKTKNLVFEKNVSEWSVAAGTMYYQNEVWQLKTKIAKNYYMIYFWAKPEVMRKNESAIQKILESLIPVEVK